MTRQRFSLCLVTDANKAWLDNQSITYDIESCPSVNIYIRDWNQLNALQKTNVTAYFVALGYHVEEEA